MEYIKIIEDDDDYISTFKIGKEKYRVSLKKELISVYCEGYLTKISMWSDKK